MLYRFLLFVLQILNECELFIGYFVLFYFIFNGSRYGSNGRSGGDHANHTTP